MKKLSSQNRFSLATALPGIAMVALSLPALATPITVVNPGFEPDATYALTNPAAGYVTSSGFGNDVAFSGSSFTGPSTADVPGWTGSGPFAVIQLLGSNYQNSNGDTSGFVGTVAGPSESTISQTLSADLQADTSYTLSYAASARPDQQNPGTAFTANLYAGSTLLASVSPTLTDNFQYFNVAYNDTLMSTAPVGQALSISFVNTAGSGSTQVLLDNVSLNGTATTPEPSTFALMLAGTGVLALAARLRQSRS